ncbi:adenosine receptor A1-like [Homarus americanus]|uniref:adenosine receptor A1-like n=1 Tax=Homarus americanus TaxID=6706 RepID=UPI001C46E711|nr:adenosine receptor A1-like [Homarus americanus]
MPLLLLTPTGIIFGCWGAGTLVGLLPMMGWHEEYKASCVFTQVMNYDYLVFLYFCTIIGPGLLMAVFYTHIYTVVLKQTKLSVKSEHGTVSQGIVRLVAQRLRTDFSFCLTFLDTSCI